jgi:hypothetical protein
VKQWLRFRGPGRRSTGLTAGGTAFGRTIQTSPEMIRRSYGLPGGPEGIRTAMLWMMALRHPAPSRTAQERNNLAVEWALVVFPASLSVEEGGCRPQVR